MGGSLGKNKITLTPAKANGQAKESTPIKANRFDGASTFERIIKKKKGTLTSKRTPHTRIDKFTSTDGTTISSSSSSTIKKIVGSSGYSSTLTDQVNYQVNSDENPNAPNKDIIELRNACVLRGAIKLETNTSVTIPTTVLDCPAVNTTVEEINVVINNEQQRQLEEQQEQQQEQESIESEATEEKNNGPSD